jgi:hypothetical protein
MQMLFAALHESVPGTNATNRHVRSNDRFGRQSGLDLLNSNLSGFDPN